MSMKRQNVLLQVVELMQVCAYVCVYVVCVCVCCVCMCVVCVRERERTHDIRSLHE